MLILDQERSEAVGSLQTAAWRVTQVRNEFIYTNLRLKSDANSTCMRIRLFASDRGCKANRSGIIFTYIEYAQYIQHFNIHYIVSRERGIIKAHELRDRRLLMLRVVSLSIKERCLEPRSFN